MRIPMNQSNECNQHTLSSIHQIASSISEFTEQFNIHHTINYSVTRTEKSQPKPHQPLPENP